MNEVANRFIEKYVDLLETEEGKVEFFKRAADSYAVGAYDAAIINNRLETAGINVTDARMKALYEYIYKQFMLYSKHTIGNEIPLVDFVNLNVRNRIGYPLDFVLKFIIEHYKDYAHLVEIYNVDNLLFIRKAT